jgi:hypothetical protein
MSVGKDRKYLEKEKDFVPLKYEKLRWKTIQDEDVWEVEEKMKEFPEE